MARMNAGPDTVHLGVKSYTTSAGFSYSDGGSSANTVPTKVTFAVRRLPSLRKVKGSFARTGKLGNNKFRWAGRVGGKRLKPGRYRLIGTVGSGPNASIRRAAFTVKR